MLRLVWSEFKPSVGPKVYRLFLNSSILMASVYLTNGPTNKYRASSNLPTPKIARDIFKAIEGNFDTKEIAMDTCENLALTWIKETKLLED